MQERKFKIFKGKSLRAEARLREEFEDAEQQKHEHLQALTDKKIE